MKLVKSLGIVLLLTMLVVSTVSAATVTSFLPKSNKLYSYKSTYYNDKGKKVGTDFTKSKYKKVGKSILKGEDPKDQYLISHWYEDSKKGIYFISGPDTAVWTKEDVLGMIKEKEAKLYLKYPVKKGATWKGKYGTLVQGDYQLKNYSAQIVSIKETVKTPYKLYKSVIKVKMKHQGYYVYRYFVKGTGLIKEETYTIVKGKPRKASDEILTKIK
ncbi:hypothetical protein [Neobacillus sp. SuZ13]|uniref:hypothetical protein n=1 Tax=Neobacillus sp. SuZ13 TaxID=3047875 RepID=UPI0024C09D2C|nr:hypothetical protein [Neobacillus sp. SuZ13]WHY66774.1 hypothetical protein QNH17_27760 [Neobacillus sp. SuZ13]